LAEDTEDAWLILERFRESLELQSPFSAHFLQSFTPEGFSSAETEGGTMSMSLPECLRWDYDEPFPKSFILCGDVFHYWNPGDPKGHREEIEAREQPGLDLLLLGTADLRERYSIAASVRLAESIEIVLLPLEENEYASSATLLLDSDGERLLELRYVDPDGNRTTFAISDYRAGLDSGTFNPPLDVIFEED